MKHLLTPDFSDETVNQLLAEKLNDQLTLVIESSPRKIYLDFKIWPNGGLGLWFFIFMLLLQNRLHREFPLLIL